MGGRGLVAAARYAARRFGVLSAMPSRAVLRLWPALVFVLPRFDIYRAAPREIRDMFADCMTKAVDRRRRLSRLTS